MCSAEQQKVLEQIVERASTFYKQQDFAHDLSHARRVHRFAVALQELEGGDRFLVEAGAWLHQLHNHIELFDTLLAKVPLEEGVLERLREIVHLCRPHRISAEASLEAKIVFDADALELVGPYGSIREVLCNAQIRGMKWADAVRAARAVQEEFVSRLITVSARTIAREASEVNQQFWTQYESWESMAILDSTTLVED